MIVFEGDYVLEECLRSVYPYASQILIAEGPVKFWQEQGRTTSTDRTNEILENFPDPENKIKVVHGQFSEKDEQCSAYLKFMNDDIDYLWNLDSDELYTAKDIEKIISILEKEKFTSVDVRSCSFYGGLNRTIGGFEERKGNFHRIFKVYPGSKWLTHRPPTVSHPKELDTLPEKHLDGDTLYHKHGVQMYHYSYVFPVQVDNKIKYYKAKVSRDNCLDDYFTEIYLPWMNCKHKFGFNTDRFAIEMKNYGVHEFKKEIRPLAFTKAFIGQHPKAIEDNRSKISERIRNELRLYNDKYTKQ